jgi:hypothetical protein
MTPGQWTTEAVMKALQGKWRVVYSELDGEMTAVDDFSTIVLEVLRGKTWKRRL